MSNETFISLTVQIYIIIQILFIIYCGCAIYSWVKKINQNLFPIKVNQSWIVYQIKREDLCTCSSFHFRCMRTSSLFHIFEISTLNGVLLFIIFIVYIIFSHVEVAKLFVAAFLSFLWVAIVDKFFNVFLSYMPSNEVSLR